MRLSLPKIQTIGLSLALMCGNPSARAEDRSPTLPGKLDAINKTLVIDGSCVQYAGNLQMNVTNFGFLGSMPNSRMPMADSPSAQWPAEGSGIEYLYAAGIWVGAEKTGVPSVSTGYPEMEFYPSSDPIDVIYRSSDGAAGGVNYPGRADDDGDHRVNEDPLNGRDDDGDEHIDEDFAALGDLMYSCRYSDAEGVAKQVWPEHLPLGIEVRQETFQWSEKQLYNFIGVHYSVSECRRRHSGECLRRHIRRPRRRPEKPRQLFQGRHDRDLGGDLVRENRRGLDTGAIQRRLCLRRRWGRRQNAGLLRARVSLGPICRRSRIPFP